MQATLPVQTVSTGMISQSAAASPDGQSGVDSAFFQALSAQLGGLGMAVAAKSTSAVTLLAGLDPKLPSDKASAGEADAAASVTPDLAQMASLFGLPMSLPHPDPQPASVAADARPSAPSAGGDAMAPVHLTPRTEQSSAPPTGMDAVTAAIMAATAGQMVAVSSMQTAGQMPAAVAGQATTEPVAPSSAGQTVGGEMAAAGQASEPMASSSAGQTTGERVSVAAERATKQVASAVAGQTAGEIVAALARKMPGQTVSAMAKSDQPDTPAPAKLAEPGQSLPISPAASDPAQKDMTKDTSAASTRLDSLGVTDKALAVHPADGGDNNQNVQANLAIGSNDPNRDMLVQRMPEQMPRASETGLRIAVEAPLRSPAFSAEFGDRLVWMASRHAQVAEITINPPQLGSIEVRLSMNGNEAGAQFYSANPNVREALDQAMPRLREVLADAGIMLGQAHVSDQSFARQEGAPRQQQFASGGQDVPEVPIQSVGVSARSQIGLGLVDLYA